MNCIQTEFTAFVKSVCDKLNCPEMASPLLEGFTAYINRIIPLTESASSKLYHFIDSWHLMQILKNNRFTPSNLETEYNGGTNNFMSFSRTGSLDEGYPVLYASEGGYSDEWCLIRLSIDGDRMNREPNFHTDSDGNVTQHSIKVKPFDWTTHEIKSGELDYLNPTNADSGKTMEMNADDESYFDTIIPTRHNVYKDRYAHPYSQAEDRLLTTGNYIPNADKFINRIDILLLPYAFSNANEGKRMELYNLLKESPWNMKTHVYTNKKSFDLSRYGGTSNEVPLESIASTRENLPDHDDVREFSIRPAHINPGEFA